MIILRTLCLLLIVSSIYGQTKNPKILLQDILKGAKEPDVLVYSIFDLDVFSYYSITEYDTELKRAVYKKTNDYKERVGTLKKMKAEMLKTKYYVKLTNITMESNFPLSSDYDLTKKGFLIKLRNSYGVGTLSFVPPKSVMFGTLRNEDLYIYFKSLPIKKNKNFFGTEDDYFFASVNEETGLKMENNKNSIDVYFLFTVTGKEKVFSKFLEMNSGLFYDMDILLLKSENVRVIIVNKTTDEVYFDKLYNLSK